MGARDQAELEAVHAVQVGSAPPPSPPAWLGRGSSLGHNVRARVRVVRARGSKLCTRCRHSRCTPNLRAVPGPLCERSVRWQPSLRWQPDLLLQPATKPKPPR